MVEWNNLYFQLVCHHTLILHQPVYLIQHNLKFFDIDYHWSMQYINNISIMLNNIIYLYLRALLSFVVKRITNNPIFSQFNTFSDKLIIDLCMNKCTRCSSTYLCSIRKNRLMSKIGGVINFSTKQKKCSFDYLKVF